jgi:hypothetical protein
MVILPSYTNLEITASNYIYLDSGNGGQVMIGGKETSGPVVLGRAGQNIAVYGNLKLTNGADIKDTTYNAVAFGENAGQNSQGWESVAIGPNAGKNTQGNFAVAVGTGAGYSSQHDLSVAVGKTAGWQTQGQAAVAVGTNAGYDGQGANAVAIGYKAGETSQHANSIIINATGSALNSSGTSRFYVDPIRNAAGDSILQYNAATKEVTYGTDPSKVTGSWTVASGANAVSITLPLNGTYSVWVNGNIPNGIVTYTATVVITNNNVPPVGTSYGWYYAAGNMLVLTSIPSQIVGTNGTISTTAGSGTTNNVFTFGITNNSGIDQMINWGYTKL